jgi:FkbM family methyltransferase
MMSGVFLNVISYTFNRVVFPLLLSSKKSYRENVYKITSDIFLYLRKSSADLFIAWEVFEMKVYQQPGFSIEKDDIVIDIGAQIGCFSLFASKKAYQGQVFAFEPLPDNYDLLFLNKTLNRQKNLSISNDAVTDKQGKQKLYISGNNTGGHSMYSTMFTGKKFVQCNTITLANILDTYKLSKVDYLKIDTEGSEYEILLNLKESSLLKIEKIVMEYHDGVRGHNHSELVDFLKRFGFIITIRHNIWEKYFFKTGVMFARRTVI